MSLEIFRLSSTLARLNIVDLRFVACDSAGGGVEVLPSQPNADRHSCPSRSPPATDFGLGNLPCSIHSRTLFALIATHATTSSIVSSDFSGMRMVAVDQCI